MGQFLIFVGSNRNFVSDYIKYVDTYHESFSWKKEVTKQYRHKSFDKLI